MHILSELRHGCVALFWFFAQRLQDNGVEIAFQSAPRRAQCATRPFGLLFTNHPLDFQTRVSHVVIRPAAHEQLIQQNSHRIDIRRFGDRHSTHLLGAGILQRHRAPFRSRHQRRLKEFGIQQFRNPEVQEPGHSVWCDQNIAGFEIAMNHPILMRVLNGGANAEEQLQAGVSGKICRPQYSSIRTPST